MASGPVDCYGSVSHEGFSFLQHTQHCQQWFKDHETALKKIFSLYLLPGFWVSAVHILIFALQKDQSSKLAENLLKTLKTK